ncbi:MAG: hypothetical protein WD844_03940 [Thermoleophilaceae bacterium]
MRTPPTSELHAPEFPRELEWINVAFLKMDGLVNRACPLVEFWDFARVNSLRTLPYTQAWHRRYGDLGLRVIGVHAPGYSFGRDPELARRAAERLEIEHPVVLDPELVLWREYGNKGWPARYLFGPDGKLRYIHYGEGDYEQAELAIRDTLRELDPRVELPEGTLDPLRPEDAPGAELAAQTADIVLPADRSRVELVRDWLEGPDYLEAADAGAGISVRFDAGGAWVVLSGEDVEQPGPYETDGTIVAESAGLRVHGFQFTPKAP